MSWVLLRVGWMGVTYSVAGGEDGQGGVTWKWLEGVGGWGCIGWG